jgi:hypothetical protein
MNFLEQLTAEWYGYHKKCFTRTNVHFGRRLNGGYKGEMDVIAYNPQTDEFIHIETSVDADSWEKRNVKFQRKFRDAKEHYMEVFPFKNKDMKPTQIAIVGFNQVRDEHRSFGENIQIIHIPAFLKEITEILKLKDPQRDAVPEGYPLLRAIQYSSFYNRE